MRVVAAPAPFAGCDVLSLRRHSRWAWGSRAGREEEEGEVVLVAAEVEAEEEPGGGRGGAARRRRAPLKRWDPELRRRRRRTAGVAGPPPSPERDEPGSLRPETPALGGPPSARLPRSG